MDESAGFGTFWTELTGVAPGALGVVDGAGELPPALATAGHAAAGGALGERAGDSFEDPGGSLVRVPVGAEPPELT